jgi:NADH-quinone oxidoreductase subunit N
MILADSPFTYTPSAADWARIAPELVLLGTALVVLLADLVGSSGRKGWLALVGLAGVFGSAVAAALLLANGDHQTAFYGMIASDQVALFADFVILFAVGIGLLYSPGYVERQGITQQGEYYALMLLAALGMMFMASATNLMIIFVGLEVLSLALYILSAYIVARSRSQEAGMKYFILSSFASGFLLYGMALTYGATGATSLAGIRAFLDGHAFYATSGFGPLLLAGLALMAVGFSFKVSAIPFQAWTPDVYVGAPTSVTAFMSVGTKVAAFVAFARVFVVTLHPVAEQWTPILWAIAVITMVGGNLLAVTQRDVKRMLAYSSIANAGYLLVAIVTDTQLSLAALLVYLAAYAAMNLGAFGVVLAIERNDGLGTTLDDFAGLSRRRPNISAAMAIFMLSLAGIPPTFGFWGKWQIFYAAIVGNHLELAIIGLLTSVLGMFYYLRVIYAMYFTEPRFVVTPATTLTEAEATHEPEVALTSGGSGTAIAVAEPQTARVAATRAAAPATPATPRTVTPGTLVALLICAMLSAVFIAAGPVSDLAAKAAASIFR